jgi:hypothetical protein
MLEQRIRYHAKLSPADSSAPPEEQFAKRYNFIVSDLVRRKLNPDGYNDDDDDDDDGGGSSQNIRYWHVKKTDKTGSEPSAAAALASNSLSIPAVAQLPPPATGDGGDNGVEQKIANATLQTRPEKTPHMDAMGKYPEYYPQVGNIQIFIHRWGISGGEYPEHYSHLRIYSECYPKVGKYPEYYPQVGNIPIIIHRSGISRVRSTGHTLYVKYICTQVSQCKSFLCCSPQVHVHVKVVLPPVGRIRKMMNATIHQEK